MAANIFQVEANRIRNYIERHGYQVRQAPDYLAVRDPVQVYSGGHRVEYQDVQVRDWAAAVKFVADRS